MSHYSEVISILILQYEKAIKREEEQEQKAFWRKTRLSHRNNISILNEKLECLKVLIEFLSGTLSDYSKIRAAMPVLKDIITVEEYLQEYYNAATLESLMKDIGYVIN